MTQHSEKRRPLLASEHGCRRYWGEMVIHHKADTALKLRAGTVRDLDALLRIAHAWRAAPTPQRITGIVSSAWDKRVYKEHLRYGNVIVAEDASEGCVGFVVAYDDQYAKHAKLDGARTEVADAAWDMLGAVVPFLIIEQMAIDPTCTRAGLDTMLLRYTLSKPHLQRFAEHGGRQSQFISHILIAALCDPGIAEAPSALSDHGFVKTLQDVEYDNHSGEAIVRQIWHVFSGLHINNAPLQHDPQRLDVLLAACQSAKELYAHEDNLNWKKLTMLGTFLFAQIAALWVITIKGIDPRLTLPEKNFYLIAAVVAGVLGLYAIELCTVMLRSGQFFMASHKANAKILQAQLRLRSADYIPVLWSVATVSQTMVRLPRMHVVARWTSLLAAVAAIVILVFVSIFSAHI